jgi:dephospho-CoA kinase
MAGSIGACCRNGLRPIPKGSSGSKPSCIPLVRKRIAHFLDAAEADGHALAIVEVPLLFESGYDYGFDAIAVTVVDEAVQRQRALARPGMTVEKLDTILARQTPQAEKRKRATYIFDTGTSIAQTRQQVAALVADIRAKGPKNEP